MKTVSLLLALLGLALLTGLAVWLGAGGVMRAVLSAGFGGFALLVIWQVGTDIVLALAWRIACPRPLLDIGAASLLLARMVRDAGMTCLPFSQIGGILIGMRATGSGRGRVPWPVAVAANIVDLTTEILGQIAFVLLGLLFLLDRKPDSDLAGPVALGMLLAIFAAGGFIWAQRGAGGLARRLSRFTSGRMLDTVETLQDRIGEFYDRPGRVAIACIVQLLGWILSAVWVWIAYRLLGARLSLGGALAIEGVASGLLSVSFLVPAALGVQEAAYVALGSVFGLDPHLSFGLSLLRRGRDLVIGAPVLLLWQWIELRRVRGREGKGAALDPLGP